MFQKLLDVKSGVYPRRNYINCNNQSIPNASLNSCQIRDHLNGKIQVVQSIDHIPHLDDMAIGRLEPVNLLSVPPRSTKTLKKRRFRGILMVSEI